MEGTEETVSTQYAPKMAGTVNWGTATVVGVFAGMLYGGSKEAAASVSKDAEVMLKLGSTPDKREQHRLMRDAMEKRFIRVTRGSIVGGVRLGMFTAEFYGLQNLLAEKLGVHGIYNVVGAGSATAATAWLSSVACKECAAWIIYGCSILFSSCVVLSHPSLPSFDSVVIIKLMVNENGKIDHSGKKLDEKRENTKKSATFQFPLDALKLPLCLSFMAAEYQSFIAVKLKRLFNSLTHRKLYATLATDLEPDNLD
ncbi:hypothetical protein D5086_028363 [Populus alba]|uniref:Uncharacterized protein n=1 Tax=Populus alba TaxID=43335 RepID=A0ACC4AYJ1_POPAL